MVRFIYFCMAVLVFSFVAVPIFSGVSKEHEKLTAVDVANAPAEEELTLEEIYAFVDRSNEGNPVFLNSIATAAGGDAKEDVFTSGFRGQEDSALADTPSEEPVE